MKYFTPERYLRLGNLDDEATFVAAQEDWERAIQRYKRHLHKIGSELPVSLRHLVNSVYLHDARVLDMWQGQRSRFTITLEPQSTPSRLIVLAYSLVERPYVGQDVLPAERCSEPIAWLYDELDVNRPAGINGSRRGRQKGLITHEILLSNGWNVRLRFRHVTVTHPSSLLPIIPKGCAAGSAPTAC